MPLPPPHVLATSGKLPISEQPSAREIRRGLVRSRLSVWRDGAWRDRPTERPVGGDTAESQEDEEVRTSSGPSKSQGEGVSTEPAQDGAPPQQVLLESMADEIRTLQRRVLAADELSCIETAQPGPEGPLSPSLTYKVPLHLNSQVIQLP